MTYDGSYVPYYLAALATGLFGTALGLNLSRTIIVALGLTSLLHTILVKMYTSRYNNIKSQLPQLKKEKVPTLVIYVPNFFCPSFTGPYVLSWLWGGREMAPKLVTARTTDDIYWVLRTASPDERIALVGVGAGAATVLELVSSGPSNFVCVVAIQWRSMHNVAARAWNWLRPTKKKFTLTPEVAKNVIYATDLTQAYLLDDAWLPQTITLSQAALDGENILHIVRAVKKTLE